MLSGQFTALFEKRYQHYITGYNNNSPNEH